MTHDPQDDPERNDLDDEDRNSGQAGDEEWISCSCHAV